MRKTSLQAVQAVLMADFQQSAKRSLDMVAAETQRQQALAPAPPTRLARGLGVGIAFGLVMPVTGALLLALALGGW